MHHIMFGKTVAGTRDTDQLKMFAWNNEDV